MRPLLVLALLAVLAGPARAELVRFDGPHPIAPKVMRGMCHIEGPHFHDYVPHKTVLYVQAPDGWAFIGDPTEFEVEVPRYAYYGHHPVFWATAGPGHRPGAHICYITGPHHHWYPPPPELRFVSRGGAYWYVGAMPPGYVRRWHRRSPMDDYYGSVTFLVPRPVITIAPPEGYVGFYAGPGYYHRRGHLRGGVGVGVHVVAPPPPSVSIQIGAPPPPVSVAPGPYVRVKGGPPPHAPAWGVRGRGRVHVHGDGAVHVGGHGGHGKKGKWR
jgi:hypothetical protein